MNRAFSQLWVCVALGAAVVPQIGHAQSVLAVDDDALGTAANCDAGAPAYTSIQAAVNAASPGDTIFICAGTYDEQVVVTKNNLTIRGAGVGATVIRPSVVAQNSTSLVTPIPVNVSPILLVTGATGVTVTNLTIDGSAHDAGASIHNCGFINQFYGIYYRNSSGTVDHVHVTKIRSASKCTNGIRGESGAGGSANLVYTGNLVDQFGDYGVSCGGLSTACMVTGNTIRGNGPIYDQIQKGVNIRAGALAEVSGQRNHGPLLSSSWRCARVGRRLRERRSSVEFQGVAQQHLCQQRNQRSTFLDRGGD